MLQTLFTWLLDQQILLSIVLFIFVLLERFSLGILRPTFVYKFALLVPLALIVSNVPDAFKPVQSTQMSNFLISSNRNFVSSDSEVFAYLYLFVVIVLIGTTLFIHWRFKKRLELTPLDFNTPVHTSIQNKTYVTPAFNTPMVIGLFTHKLVLPSDYSKRFSSEALALILEHEYVHIKRRDNLTNAIALGLTILFWFNPFSWLSYTSFRRLQELSCDQQVLVNKTHAQQVLYSKALVNCAEQSNARLIAYSNYGDKKMMLKRLALIRHNKKPSILAKGGLILVSACILSTLAIAKTPQLESKESKEVLPIERVDPIYPAHAVEQGLNGSVVLKYDITPSGNTSNIIVVSDTPKGVFNREAKKALAKWRYPSSEGGYQNVLVQLDFALSSDAQRLAEVEQVK